jgi:hypothetical protein
MTQNPEPISVPWFTATLGGRKTLKNTIRQIDLLLADGIMVSLIAGHTLRIVRVGPRYSLPVEVGDPIPIPEAVISTIGQFCPEFTSAVRDALSGVQLAVELTADDHLIAALKKAQAPIQVEIESGPRVRVDLP